MLEADVASTLDSKIIHGVIGKEPVFPGCMRELTALEVHLISQEEGLIIAGAGHVRPIQDINRLIAQYGGEAGDWVKMSSRDILKAGRYDKTSTTEIHWYENLKTGQRVDAKLKKNVLK